MANSLPDSALFVCFGGMSNVGTLTGLAGLEAVKRAGPGKAAIFCLGGLPTGAPSVIEKTTKVGRIINVDGCPMTCARKIVEQAGFRPNAAITLVNDCSMVKGPPTQYTADDLEAAVTAILAAMQADAQPQEA